MNANEVVGWVLIAALIIGVLYAISQKPKTLKVEKEEAEKETIDLSKLTKLQLEAKGREIGIELDRRQLKAKLVAQLETELAKKGK